MRPRGVVAWDWRLLAVHHRHLLKGSDRMDRQGQLVIAAAGIPSFPAAVSDDRSRYLASKWLQAKLPV
jgi:hypothetical protein